MTDRDKISYAKAFASALPAPKARSEPTRKYNFGSGHNDPDAIPVEGFAAAAASVLRREGRSLAVYSLGGSALGYKGLREVVVDKLNRHRGMDVSIDDVLITSGSLQGLDLVNALLLERGDVAIIEEFTYSAVLGKLKVLGVEAIPAPLDDGGIDMDRLEQLLAGLKASGRRAKYIYTIPTIQNPTGTILGVERRQRLIELARAYETPIFEDECYADLIWAGGAPPSLYAMAPDQVIHIGSFSKTLAPALRLGYVVAPWQALGQIAALKQDGGTGALDQMVAAEYFRDHFDAHVEKLTGMLKRKLDVLLEALDREFGAAVTVRAPEGGLFVWVRFPDDIDVRVLTKPANDAGVAFNPGTDWSVRPEDATNFIRLCFGLATEDEINEGIAELARVSFETIGLPERSANRAHRGRA
jgi:2-aminoadipate transaminase